MTHVIVQIASAVEASFLSFACASTDEIFENNYLHI